MNRNRFNEPTLYNSNRNIFTKTNTFKETNTKSVSNCSKLVKKFTSIGDLSTPQNIENKPIKFSTMMNTTAILKFQTSSFSYSSNALNKLNDKLERSNLASLKFARYDTVQKSDANIVKPPNRELKFNDFKLLKKNTVSSTDLKSYCSGADRFGESNVPKLIKLNETENEPESVEAKVEEKIMIEELEILPEINEIKDEDEKEDVSDQESVNLVEALESNDDIKKIVNEEDNVVSHTYLFLLNPKKIT